MEADANSQTIPALAPVASSERIQALDVVRGFALIGIFLMNIEFFNRTHSGIMMGMPLGLTGIDWFASWFIAYFVQGKFWTIFSLLFGMGFAVMLTRAERAERDFIGPYVRRIGALAVIGAVHYIFLWAGDILFSYAVAAAALLILLYGKWKPIVIAFAILLGIAFIPRLGPVGAMAGGLALVGLLALYMRNERHITIRRVRLPVFSFILLLIGTIAFIAALVLWALPSGPKEPRIPVTIMSIAALIVSYLSAKYRDPVELRGLRLGVTLYIFSATMMTVFGVVEYFKPAEPDIVVSKPVPSVSGKPVVAHAPSTQVKPVDGGVDGVRGDKAPAADAPKSQAKGDTVAEAGAHARADAKADGKTDSKSSGKPETGESAKKPEKTEAQKAAERKAERAKRLAARLEEDRNEERILTKGTYLEGVEMRARDFPEKAAGDAGFATVLIAMFLIGVWFVRSGVMEDTAAHLPLFRKLAMVALPVGVGLGLLGSLIAVSHVPGDSRDGFQMARGLAMLGNLPACLGYVGAVVMMLHSKTMFAGIRVLAPAGRMALTTYLTQSLISTYIFYGYGLGHWGMPRAWQVVYVAIFFALQLAFSHWWLARYRYGPIEWLWRGFTYRQVPAMRI
jgi:uncharacterized membrane protein YeiB